jgi:curved DNA-binding protein CbpA
MLISKNICRVLRNVRTILDFDPKVNYYAILGIPKNSTEKQIKAAYYKLAQKHHPDKNNGKESNKFKDITNAYNILSDTAKRSQYDAMYGSPFSDNGDRGKSRQQKSYKQESNNSWGSSYSKYQDFNDFYSTQNNKTYDDANYYQYRRHQNGEPIYPNFEAVLNFFKSDKIGLYLVYGAISCTLLDILFTQTIKNKLKKSRIQYGPILAGVNNGQSQPLDPRTAEYAKYYKQI